MCIRHSTTYEDDCLDQGGEKKRRSVSSWDTANNQSTTKRRRQQGNSFVIYLSECLLSHQFLKVVDVSRRELQSTLGSISISMLIDGMRKLSWMGNNGILVVMIMRRTLLLIMIEQYLSIERV
jgi:hypothetical protein